MKKYEKVEMSLYDAFLNLLDSGDENEVFNTIKFIKDDSKTHEDIYRLAKKYYRNNRPLSIKLMNTIINNRKYFNGFRAYTYCIDQDEKGIDDMVNYLKITYLTGQLAVEEYNENLNEIISSITKYCPSKTKELLETINNVSIV